MKKQQREKWQTKLDDIFHGLAGGFLFSAPLLFTMEIWVFGTVVTPPRLMAMLAVMLTIVFFMNLTSGFQKRSSGLWTAVAETIEAVGIALVSTAIVLFVFRRWTVETPLPEIVGKVIFASFPFALGMSVANHLLKGDRNQEGQEQGSEATGIAPVAISATVKNLGATVVGSLFLGLTVAPTEEIRVLAVELSPPWLLAVMAMSLLVSYVIVFESDFAGRRRERQQLGAVQRPSIETIASYLVSLLVAAAELMLFAQLTPRDPWGVWLSSAVVLGFVTSIGGAAGRIAV